MIDPRLVAIIRKVTKNPDIDIAYIKDPFMFIGWDSLTSVEIVIEIQDEFGIVIEPDEILRIGNLWDLQQLIRRKRGEGTDVP